MRDSIKPRERDAIIQSLRAGVVPRVGLRHLQVGRLDEVTRHPEGPRAHRAGRRQRSLHHRQIRRRQELLPEPGPHRGARATIRRRPRRHHARAPAARLNRPGPQPLRRADAQPLHPRQARRRSNRQRRRALGFRPRSRDSLVRRHRLRRVQGNQELGSSPCRTWSAASTSPRSSAATSRAFRLTTTT